MVLHNNLFQKIKEIGKKLELKENDILFDIGKDTSIYFVEKGKIGLFDKNDNLIFSVFGPTIIGERSFVSGNVKPLKAKVLTDIAEIYFLSSVDFLKLDHNTQIEFLSLLVEYISSRVYKINEILQIIKNISDKSLFVDFKSEKIKQIITEIFDNFLKNNKWALFKIMDDDIMFIDGTLYPDENIIDFVKNNKFISVKLGKNYLLFVVDNYIYIVFGDILIDAYILENAISYSISNFKFIAQNIEKKKNEFIKQSLKNGI